MASSRRLSKLPGLRLIEPTIARLLVGEQHLGVQLEVLELVDLDADVVENAYSADTLDQLFLLKGVRRAGHHVDLHAAASLPAPGAR